MIIRSLLKRSKTPCEVEEELQFHIEMLERKYAQQGMPSADAKGGGAETLWKSRNRQEAVRGYQPQEQSSSTRAQDIVDCYCPHRSLNSHP